MGVYHIKRASMNVVKAMSCKRVECDTCESFISPGSVLSSTPGVLQQSYRITGIKNVGGMALKISSQQLYTARWPFNLAGRRCAPFLKCKDASSYSPSPSSKSTILVSLPSLTLLVKVDLQPLGI